MNLCIIKKKGNGVEEEGCVGWYIIKRRVYRFKMKEVELSVIK